MDLFYYYLAQLIFIEVKINVSSKSIVLTINEYWYDGQIFRYTLYSALLSSCGFYQQIFLIYNNIIIYLSSSLFKQVHVMEVMGNEHQIER